MPNFLLEPLDVLFFRDARPMAAGQGTGHGSRQPLPSTLHEALRAALLYSWGDKSAEAHSRNNFVKRASTPTPTNVGHGAFQSLRLSGPFLHGLRERQADQDDTAWSGVPECHKHADLRLPLPLDVVIADRARLEVLHPIPDANAAPFPFLPVSPVAATKDTPSRFWTPLQLAAYLASTHTDFTPLSRSHLFEDEHRVGVELTDDTLTAREGQLYAASYLRPRRHTRFWFAADIPDRRRDKEIALLNQLDFLLFGGDRRLARVWNHGHAPKLDISMPDFEAHGFRRVKWVLLTPAIFAGGWLPGWVDTDSLSVKLRVVQRPERATRRKARCNGLKFDVAADQAPPIEATLVSVCLGRAQPITGWDLLNESAKPTQLAVPAGSVFYFECPTPKDAHLLGTALHLRPRSDALGEKGFGLGVCGTWSPFPTSPDVPTPDNLPHV